MKNHLLFPTHPATCLLATVLLSTPCYLRADDAAPARLEISGGTVKLTRAGAADIFHYLTEKPENSALTANSTCCFHPLTTPAGHVVTAFAPDDHKHHRGIFLAWVEMHGAADADFWGWGAHAPVDGRRIVNRSLTAEKEKAAFTAVNEWRADDLVLVEETLKASAATEKDAHVLDLTYELKAAQDVKLSRWAFSGFCVRFPKEGETVIHSPAGIVKTPNPSHDKPDTNWPDAPWYAATWTASGGAAVGVAIVPVAPHPPATWHNHRDLRMLNPAITGPGDAALKAGKPTVLHYKVVAFDGEVPATLLNKLAAK